METHVQDHNKKYAKADYYRILSVGTVTVECGVVY